MAKCRFDAQICRPVGSLNVCIYGKSVVWMYVNVRVAHDLEANQWTVS